MRLRQVESLLGTIIGSADPRAQSLIEDLKSDALARDIIDRVDGGPFGPAGRLANRQEVTPESYINAITQSATGRSRGDSRAQREPRVNREMFSSNQGLFSLPLRKLHAPYTRSIQDPSRLPHLIGRKGYQQVS